MNSVYKRYFIITFIMLFVSGSIIVNNSLKLFNEIDSVNAYAAEKGSADEFDFRQLGVYIGASDEGEREIYYPDFHYSRDKIADSNGIWVVAVSIMLLMFYLYERSTLTADFCAVLPVKSRSKFLVKAVCFALAAAVFMLLEMWNVMEFNQRVAACNETYSILGVTEETVYAIEMYPLGEITALMQKLFFAAALMLLAEMTGKVYLPVCIWVLGTFAVAGSLAGLYEYFYVYYNYNVFSLIDGVSVYALRYGYLSEYIYTFALTGITLVCTLWALFLSGRGDMSRKGRVFRFAWAQWIALACITVCAVFCTFEVIWLSELNYVLSAGMSLAAMLIVGVIAFFVARRIIFWLGR